jgi:hypothetical protein
MDSQTKDALLALAEGQKGHYIAISSMLAEIVALRETVRGLDPTFSEVMEHKRAQAFEEDSEVRKAIIDSLDRILLRLKGM